MLPIRLVTLMPNAMMRFIVAVSVSQLPPHAKKRVSGKQVQSEKRLSLVAYHIPGVIA
jgi:hypothetical protein